MKLKYCERASAAGMTLTAILFLAAFTLFSPAQTPDTTKQTPDVQQLKDRVKQLEQTVEELKMQISSIEDIQKQKGPANDVSASTTVPPVSAVPVDKPKSSQDSKGESTFEVYGFAMLDAGYQFKQNDPNWFDTVRPTKLAAFKGEFDPDGHTYFGVRQSRLGVKSSTPTRFGTLKTVFEFELFGTGVDAGQTTFRLRHAYGELGKFGAGQYWTVFGDVDAFPNTIEYWGPNGLVWFRNVQLRFMPLKGKNEVTIALERPGASADQGRYQDRIELQGVRPKLAWPDLTGNVRFNRNWGHIQVAGIVRSIRWVDTNNTDQFDLSGSDVGIGTSVTGVFNFSKKDVGRFQATYGKGIENYMNDAPVDVGIKRLDDPNRPIKGVALPMFAYSAYLDHTWNKKFSSAAGYSYLNIENSSGQNADAFRRGHYASANLLYYPVDRVTIGGEFLWGRRENFQDHFGTNDFRIQFAFKYNFSKVFKFD
jgi:hypothetical protein